MWIALNHAVWPWDPALYGEVSVDLWFSLAHSLRQWCGLMATGLSMKPPGIVWIGQFFVPIGQFFGSIEAGLLLSVLLTQFGLLLFTFKIGQQMLPKSRLVPVAGVVFGMGFFRSFEKCAVAKAKNRGASNRSVDSRCSGKSYHASLLPPSWYLCGICIPAQA